MEDSDQCDFAVALIELSQELSPEEVKKIGSQVIQVYPFKVENGECVEEYEDTEIHIAGYPFQIINNGQPDTNPYAPYSNKGCLNDASAVDEDHVVASHDIFCSKGQNGAPLISQVKDTQNQYQIVGIQIAQGEDEEGVARQISAIVTPKISEFIAKTIETYEKIE